LIRLIRGLPLQLPLGLRLSVGWQGRGWLPRPDCTLWPLETLGGRNLRYMRHMRHMGCGLRSRCRRHRGLRRRLERRHAVRWLENLGRAIGRFRCGRRLDNRSLGDLLLGLLRELRGAEGFGMRCGRRARRRGALLRRRLQLLRGPVPGILSRHRVRHQGLQAPRRLWLPRLGERYRRRSRRGSERRPNPVGGPSLLLPRGAPLTHPIRLQRFCLLAIRLPHAQPLQRLYLLLQRVILALALADLVDGMAQVRGVQLGMGRLDLLQVLAGVAQGQARRGLQPALLGGGLLGTTGIGAVGVVGRLDGPELLAQQAQKQVAQGVGVQTAGIVGRGGLDEPVAAEGVRDAHKVGVVEAVLGDSAEQQEGFERRVRCRRSIHAPDCAPRGTEGTAAALDKVNWRHDLQDGKGHVVSARGVRDGGCNARDDARCLSPSVSVPSCLPAAWRVRPTRHATQNTYRQPEPGAPVNSADGRGSVGSGSMGEGVRDAVVVGSSGRGRLTALAGWRRNGFFWRRGGCGHVMARVVAV